MAHWGMEDVQACFGDTADLNTRQITVGGQRLGLLFLDGLTSGGDIAEQVLKPLMETVTPGSIQEVLTQAERARVYCAVAERTQDPAQTADKLLLAIEDTGSDWIKPTWDLYYSIQPDGTYDGTDYPSLTYNDLFNLQAYITEKTGEQNQTIYNLMYHKLYWMWANNVTDYKR